MTYANKNSIAGNMTYANKNSITVLKRTKTAGRMAGKGKREMFRVSARIQV